MIIQASGPSSGMSSTSAVMKMLARVVLGVGHVLQVAAHADLQCRRELGQGGVPVSALAEQAERAEASPMEARPLPRTSPMITRVEGWAARETANRSPPICVSSSAARYSQATRKGPIRRGGGRSRTR